MPISKLEARELMSRAYEMGATVLEGTLQRSQDGTWVVDERSLERVLGTLDGQQVAIVVAPVGTVAGVKRICRVCGTEYEGSACPRCRQVRQRLRGRG
jgi:hypothetical protein